MGIIFRRSIERGDPPNEKKPYGLILQIVRRGDGKIVKSITLEAGNQISLLWKCAAYLTVLANEGIKPSEHKAVVLEADSGKYRKPAWLLSRLEKQLKAWNHGRA